MPQSTSPHVLKFKADINKFSLEDLPETRAKLLEDIRHFSRAKLQKLPVYFASINYDYRNTFIPYHGFLVSGNPYPSTPRDRGKIYWFVVDIMKAPYEVTPKIVAETETLPLPSGLKEAVRQMQGQKFATVEYFLRELMLKHAEIDNEFISAPEIDYNIHYPGKALRKMVDLNSYLNRHAGSYTPKSVAKPLAEEDLESYWEGSTTYRPVNVATLSLMEALSEQLIYSRYLDERLGIGKSVEESAKFDRLLSITPEEKQALTAKWVEHIEFPKSIYQANCNSASASLLQYAMNKEQHKSPVNYQALQAATMFAFCKNHRMYIHNPLLYSECINELEAYIEKRNAYGNKFWGKMFKLTKDVKLMAARKMLEHVTKHITLEDFLENEVTALTQGKLGKLVEKYPQTVTVLETRQKPKANAVTSPLVGEVAAKPRPLPQGER